MSARAESMVLVEGYDDRDFWKGLLEHKGCAPAPREPSRHRLNGQYLYLTPSKTLLYVVPCKGGVSAAAVRQMLKDRHDKPLRRLVVSPDADTHATLDDARRSVRTIVEGECGGVVATPEGDLLVDGGKLVVSTLFVHADAARDERGALPTGVPTQRALEQLACAALCRVHPKRGEKVAQWLASRDDPRGKDHKAHAWSYYAGWSTDHGTGDFYGSLWRDKDVAPVLDALLRAQDAWRVVEALLEP